jgi:hypothetical protein
MDWAELNAVLNSINEQAKLQFELNRMVMHSIYQVNSRKRLKPTDIMQFDWDKETTEDTPNTNLLSLDDATKLINNINDGKEKL